MKPASVANLRTHGDCFILRPWEVLGSAIAKQPSPVAMCNIFITIELYRGQQKTLRSVVSNIQIMDLSPVTSNEHIPEFPQLPANNTVETYPPDA